MLVTESDLQERRAETVSEEHCPFCFEESIRRVTDCFDERSQKICELWYCRDCGGFFPRSIQIDVEEKKSGPRRRDHDLDLMEKRKTPRFPVQFVVQVDFEPGDDSKPSLFRRKKDVKLSEPIVAMVMNAGIGGLAFRYPEFVKEGQEGTMRISLPSAQRSFSAVGRVVRSTKLPDGSYGLGVQFVEVEPEYRLALQRYISLE